MSRLSQNPVESFQTLPDVTCLAEKLQEAAQALIAFGQSAAEKDFDPDDNPQPEKKTSEYRTYRIPCFIVQEEREMLKLYRVGSWQEMFNKAYDQLYTIALLMRHFDAVKELDGFSVQLMGNMLMAPIDMLSRLCSLVADFRLAEEE